MLVVALLCLAAFVAGAVDAIAGGGGLLSVPALLVATPDVRVALATNKGQSVFGAATSLVSYARAGHVDPNRAIPSFLAAFAGSIGGARLVLSLRPEALRPLVLVLLLGAVAFFALGRRLGPGEGAPASRRARTPWAASRAAALASARPTAAALAIGLVLGAYDGFFGPGTGTLLIALNVAAFGDALTEATANAKVANFASNLAACVAFGAAGAIDYRLALPMAAAQAAGGYVGARVAIRGGDRLIRVAVLAVSLALAARLGWQILAG